jgi:two-component system LytT family response regulator
MPVIVFVTAYQEFAVRAFESRALDYLVKPVSQARFDAAMLRVRERIRLGESEALAVHLAALLEAERKAPPPPSGRQGGPLLVATSSGKLALDAAEIDWIEARDYYSCIHAGGRRYLIRESMRALERRLGREEFARVHRGAIVRLSQVREVRTPPSGMVLILKSGARIPVSRRKRETLNRSLRKSHRSL